MSIKRFNFTIIAILMGSLLVEIIAQDFGELYRRANNGEAWAMNNLANSYADGEGVEKDLNKAIYWYKKGSENGSAVAMYNLSSYYRKGEVVEKNNEKALELLKRSAKLNFPKASKELGVAYFNGNIGLKSNYNIAKGHLKDACFTGNAEAMCYYGWLHAKGLGAEKDKYKAEYWLNKSVENGYTYANIPLYILSYEDDDFWGNSSYYEKEALKTISYQRFCYLVASYFDKEYIRCINENDKNKDFYGEAAFNMLFMSYTKTQDALACAGLGIYYEDGIGVKTNLENALAYYIKSYELGHPNMLHHIKRACRNLDKLEVFFDLLSRNIESADADMLNELAYCYAKGIGTKTDINMAHTVIDRAIQLSPIDPNLYDSKGEFYMFSDDRKNARKMYKKVIKMNPTFYADYPNSKLYNYINIK